MSLQGLLSNALAFKPQLADAQVCGQHFKYVLPQIGQLLPQGTSNLADLQTVIVRHSVEHEHWAASFGTAWHPSIHRVVLTCWSSSRPTKLVSLVHALADSLSKLLQTGGATVSAGTGLLAGHIKRQLMSKLQNSLNLITIDIQIMPR